ncbi:MAG: amidase [Hyphomicrobiaceae bacterium]
MTQPCDLTATEARRLIGSKKLSPRELLASCLDRIERVDGALNAVVACDPESARRDAEIAEEMVMQGEPLSLLHGLPVAIKDLQATGGLRTTYGSLLYRDHIPAEDDDTVANVRGAGAIVFAKTNTPEFGAGANTRNRVYGATGNPFDPALTCGGSSGGSAVALAAGMVPLATGSDYGGSLRTPAAFCGIVGFRPSPGLVPDVARAVALNPFSVQGPMARSVDDAYMLLRAQADYDPADPYASSGALELPESLAQLDLSQLPIAISPDLGCAPVARMIRATFESRTRGFADLFGAVEEAAPDFTDVHEIFEVMRGVNFVAAHGTRLAEGRALLGPNVIDNTERGLAYSVADVARAHTAQTALLRRVHEFFDDHSVLICPAAAVSPFPHAELSVAEIDGEAMPTYMRWLALTYAPTTALCCAAALPCGVDANGLPFGIQVIGPRGSDLHVLMVARALELVFASDPSTARPFPDIARLETAPPMQRPAGAPRA